MKLFLAVCFAFLALSNADEYVIKNYNDLLQYRKECMAELNVPVSNIEQYKKLEFPNDAITQCYLKCVFSKFGLFDEKTGFNVENVHIQVVNSKAEGIEHNDEVHAKIENCVDNNSQGSSACEWAYRGATCIIKQNLKLIKQNPAASAATTTTTS